MSVPQQPDHAAFRRVWDRVMPDPRPDCPIALAPPPPLPARPAALPPPVCLGESSQGDLPGLEGLLALTADAGRSCRALLHSRRDPLFSALAAAKESQLRRLGTAYFLITGRRFSPRGTAPVAAGPLPLALRTRYHAEQRAALAFFAAAGTAADPCLAELYRTLGAEDRRHADQIRAWLEGRK